MILLSIPGNAPAEAHLTLEPSSEITYAEFVQRGKELGWRASKFDHDDVDGIAGKWFLTRGGMHGPLHNELAGMYHGLSCSGFEILRAKIEVVTFDTKRGDSVEDL